MRAAVRTMRAVLFRDVRLSLTYKSWVINRTLGPIVWVTIAVYTYLGIASPASISEGFTRFGEDAGFTGFLIIGQTIFSIFMALNFWGGMAIERERWYGTLEIVLLSPMNRTAYVLAEAVFGILNSSWTIFLAMVVAIMTFGMDVSVASVPAVVVSLAATLVSMVALGMFFAGFYILSRAAGPLAHSVGAPIRFFSGTNFPVSALPTMLQYVSYALPVTYGMGILRRAILSGGDMMSVLPDVGVLMLFTVIFFSLGVYFLHRMERSAKTSGTLHTY